MDSNSHVAYLAITNQSGPQIFARTHDAQLLSPLEVTLLLKSQLQFLQKTKKTCEETHRHGTGEVVCVMWLRRGL